MKCSGENVTSRNISCSISFFSAFHAISRKLLLLFTFYFLLAYITEALGMPLEQFIPQMFRIPGPKDFRGYICNKKNYILQYYMCHCWQQKGSQSIKYHSVADVYISKDTSLFHYTILICGQC